MYTGYKLAAAGCKLVLPHKERHDGANPPNTKGPCPQLTSATISGTIVAADIFPIDMPAPPGQGFTNGDLADVIRYILAGDGYANVHTAKYPGGEIRGQIRVSDDEHD